MAAAVLVAAVVSLTVAAVLWRGGSAPRPPLYFGVAVPRADPALQEQLAARVGTRPSLVGLFVTLDRGFTTADLAARVHGSGMAPLVTLEPWSWASVPGQMDPRYSLRELLRGDHDAALSQLAAQLAAYHKRVYLRFAHEMNGRWYPWAEGVNGNRPGQYVAAWRHVHNLFAAAGASNVRWLWAPNVLGQLRGEAASLAELYPGDAYVDLLGMTGYGRDLTAAVTFDATLDQLETLSAKPVVIAETGAAGPGKAAWIASFGPWLDANPRVLAFVWFNIDPVAVPGATGDYRLDDTPRTLAAFRSMLAGLTRLLVPGRPAGADAMH